MKKLLLIALVSLNISSAFAGPVTTVTTEQFEKTLKENTHRKMVFFFQSTCNCMKEITSSNSLPKEKVLLVSIDNNKNDLEEFAKNTIYDIYYIAPTANGENILKMSKNIGINLAKKESDKIVMNLPHITLFDKDSKVVMDNIKKVEYKKYLD